MAKTTPRFVLPPSDSCGSPDNLKLNDDFFYTDRQVAKIYGVHPITIWNWARRGIISPPTKIGPHTSRWQGRSIRRDVERKMRSNG